MAERTLLPVFRRTLKVIAAAVLPAGFLLFVLSSRTDRWFAWTIAPPITAAFMGAAYWTSFVLVWTCARRRAWTDARIVAPTILAFTTATLIATLLHLDRFHLSGDDGPYLFGRVVAWIFVGIYVAIPPAMAALMLMQRRQPGEDPPRTERLAPWARWTAIGQAAVWLLLGLALMVAPTDAGKLWPWELTPLTGRAIGAWLIGIGVAAAHVAWEDDLRRVRPAFYAYAGLTVMLLLTVVLHAEDFQWGEPSGWVFLAFLPTMAVVGVWGILASRPVAGD
jgi:hypothetical protein